MQHGSRPWIGRQLAALVALAVGEEDQPSLQAAQDHQAGRGNGVAGCGRDGHGFRHRLAGRAGRVQPRGELPQRVSIQVCGIHPPSLAPPRPVNDIDLGGYAAKRRSAALLTVTFGHVRDGIGTVRPPDSRSAVLALTLWTVRISFRFATGITALAGPVGDVAAGGQDVGVIGVRHLDLIGQQLPV